MPATAPILDPSSFRPEDAIAGKEEIEAQIPQRGEFSMLHGILHMDEDKGICVGYKTLGDDEFWVPGHIPERPLFPGVLMIETAAQLCGYAFAVAQHNHGFFGFASVDAVRFRGTVVPGDVFIVMVKGRKLRRKLGMYDTQGYVDGKLVFEAIITGMIVPT